METRYMIRGYVVGDIWMPCGECYKPLKLEFVRNEVGRPSPWIDAHESLRDAMLAATNDGDFRSCRVADGVLYITRTERTATGKRTHERVMELSSFPSVADMVELDWSGTHDDEEDD